jgi:hypothetical protein
MANTITNIKQINGSKNHVAYITLASDGTNETNTVIYDSSTYSGTDSLKNRIKKIHYSFDGAATARAKLLWDATTKVLAFTIPPQMSDRFDFSSIGGLSNPAGAGITGDIVLTTTGLAAGDSLIIVLEMIND